MEETDMLKGYKHSQKKKHRSAFSSLSLGLLTFFLCLFDLHLAWANEVIYLSGNDVVELSRAASGVASPRGASCCYINPASMVDLDRRIDLNLFSLHNHLELFPDGLAGNGRDGILESDAHVVFPTGGIIWPLSKGVLGVGLYLPLAGKLDFGHPRNILERLRRGNLDDHVDYLHTRLILGYGYRFENGWALGINLQGSVSRVRTNHYTPLLRPNDADFQWDHAYGAGFGLGLYKRWERFSVGVSYSSRQWSQHMKKYTDLFWYPIDLPETLQAGVAIGILPSLECTLDFKFKHWESIAFFGAPNYRGGLHWRDQIGVSVGLEWQASPRFTLRAGYAHMNTPLRPDAIFTNTLIPACVEDYATAGLSYKIGSHMEIHLAYVKAFENTLIENGEGDIYSRMGRGATISSEAQAFAMGLSFMF